MTTETIFTVEQMRALIAEADTDSQQYLFRFVEQAVLQSITGDADRIEAAAKMLSKCLDYPWEFMTSQGHDSMRDYARATINAAMEKQPCE